MMGKQKFTHPGLTMLPESCILRPWHPAKWGLAPCWARGSCLHNTPPWLGVGKWPIRQDFLGRLRSVPPSFSTKTEILYVGVSVFAV